MTTTNLQPAAAENCAPEPHVWVAHMRGGEPIHVEICMGCGQFNWEGIREQIFDLVARKQAASILPDHLRGDGPCQDCRTPDNIGWFAPNVVWNHVMGGPEAMGDPGGIICIPCFVKRTDAAGLAPTGWQLVPEWRWTEKATTKANPAAPA